eukprot:CAMPEP_0115253694 /NCGR_PEP_ID=MMETSP0270-20121206/44805_1 /TAXON_ID=71861 /ORGANISM="Scrippsiella trochoidea, Strain CCMP3099" /LENGTH=58 /DNA_ID=CAMNT_0002669209 /DNA_START=227 /DNA_END=406 /DNA_ORIENTATION=+
MQFSSHPRGEVLIQHFDVARPAPAVHAATHDRILSGFPQSLQGFRSNGTPICPRTKVL